MIAVVDYQKGNLKGVERGLIAVGGDAVITADPAVIAAAEAIVLPGVGAFADAAATMEELGQMAVIRQRVADGVPFLGICLGMQLMFEEGIEGSPAEDDECSSNNAKGLAILPGVVVDMPREDAQGVSYKVPHVGWNSVEVPAEGTDAAADVEAAACDADANATDAADGGFASPILKGIPQGEYFYFTHSYIAPDTPATVAVTEHSRVFPSVVQYGDVAFGVQFHPEKSSDAGAQLLRNFVDIVKGQ